MFYFFLACAMLIAGYFVYGKIVEANFGVDNCRATPACRMEDGVDFVKMDPKKIYLIQLLNIAGLGPIFGPILGALYGPAALVWIVLGSIFAGAVHDYFSGMLSVRYDGKSIPDAVGYNLGKFAKQFMNVFSIVLLLLVGVVFVLGPAKLLANKIGFDLDNATAVMLWTGIIFAYYFLATILPVDKIIGRLYPLFALALLIMAGGLSVMLIVDGYTFFPNGVGLANVHPTGLPLWPLMFITIACGAISGFHATQSPLMARCIPDEKCGRPVFYGAMIGEGIIALVWATLGMTFYQTPEALQAVLAQGGPAAVVDQVATTLMGPIGGFLAIIGVIILPISSGDTAFRSARLIIADFTNIAQRDVVKRLMIAVPLFAVGFLITKTEFGVIWRYFGFSNQTLATIVLWAAAMYLVRHGKVHWIATVPAVFMTAVCATYLCVAPEFPLHLSESVGYGIGIAVAAACFVWFMFKARNTPVVVDAPDSPGTI
ncbi:carbon starvation CstA family protein [Desulfovibrio psychrotolerans]|uniref:Carbon starvation protein A n=1 Tax=Desulfovibrio psychrotolerans TaxID=415242 RepID=A0A7J0BVT9_9BACT|nr:carbon starvation protein A [Desulfovibrio psychrotolerans]GFM37827.1 carbon starvation protein A [Desulfovibrio psychrotolerans]